MGTKTNKKQKGPAPWNGWRGWPLEVDSPHISFYLSDGIFGCGICDDVDTGIFILPL